MLDVESKVSDDDIRLTDAFPAPGYGSLNQATSNAVLLGAQTEGLVLDPVYTGGTPAIFAYQDAMAEALTSIVAGHRE